METLFLMENDFEPLPQFFSSPYCTHYEYEGNIYKIFNPETASDYLRAIEYKIEYLSEMEHSPGLLFPEKKIYLAHQFRGYTTKKVLTHPTYPDFYALTSIKNNQLKLKLMKDFLNLIRELHRLKITHNDLHRKNILISIDEVVRIIDFDRCNIKVTTSSEYRFDQFHVLLKIARLFKLLKSSANVRDLQINQKTISRILYQLLALFDLLEPKDNINRYLEKMEQEENLLWTR